MCLLAITSLWKFFFLLQNFTEKRFIFTTDLYNLIYNFFPFLNLGTFTFSLKGNTIWIVSITILGLWEPLLSKIGVPWTLALWYHNSWDGKWEDHGCPLTKSCPTLWPHGLQHTRLLCPPLSSRVCSNLCPLSQWCYLTISSSATSFSSCLRSFSASGSFPVSRSSHQVAKVLELQLQHQSFQWIFRISFLWDWLGISLWSKGLSRVVSSTSKMLLRG